MKAVIPVAGLGTRMLPATKASNVGFGDSMQLGMAGGPNRQCKFFGRLPGVSNGKKTRNSGANRVSCRTYESM